MPKTRCNKCSTLLTKYNRTLGNIRKSYYICKKCIREYNRVAGLKDRRSLKAQVIKAYGGKCKCCGENHFEFLTIDHKTIARKQLENLSGDKLYRYLRDKKFPKKHYQLLCLNCNFAKGHYGTCPHKEK